jgi:hypothetical protein
MKYTVEMASYGMLYAYVRVQCFMKMGSGHSGNIKVITSRIWEAIVLVLLIRSIYNVRHRDGPSGMIYTYQVS